MILTDPWHKEKLQRFFEALEARGTTRMACRASGINRRAFYRWREKGAELHQKMEAAADVDDGEVVEFDVDRLSERDKFYLELYLQYNKSKAIAALSAVETIASVGFGGHTTVETRTELIPVYDEDKKKFVNKKKITTTEKQHGPSWQALAWILERTNPDEFARKLFSITDPKDEDETPKLDSLLHVMQSMNGSILKKSNGAIPPKNGTANGTASEPESTE
jgi:hypothetical protein